MRTRKKKGKKSAAVIFTVDDILDMCRKKAEEDGYDVGRRMFLKIAQPKQDSLGRKRPSNVEVEILLDTDP